MEVETGWRFSTADFSIQAAGNVKARGRVMLVRSPEDKKKWYLQPDKLIESEECPELYVTGVGVTIEDAFIDANLAAANAKPIVVDKAVSSDLDHKMFHEKWIST